MYDKPLLDLYYVNLIIANLVCFFVSFSHVYFELNVLDLMLYTLF